LAHELPDCWQNKKTLSLDIYPTIPLFDARKQRDEARKQSRPREGRDPSIAKAIDKQAKRHAAENTFKAITLEWHAKNAAIWAQKTVVNVKRYLEKDIFPWLGDRPIKDINAPELLAVLRKIESRGVRFDLFFETSF
jgi:hypothetical protein